ncbi:hypothetical protein BS47DRAFT_1367652 [Hydnum rufescens UP504]|uniref:Uncharacterized protein n=1 Tax=Hydnum rufescens UP504 TaxID=1448309 RepID=A0A9P6DP91_9AGAM|nr:hypothetical protein BS47DRAFT_1367652 [Hydnum rufescens UP504]
MYSSAKRAAEAALLVSSPTMKPHPKQAQMKPRVKTKCAQQPKGPIMCVVKSNYPHPHESPPNEKTNEALHKTMHSRQTLPERPAPQCLQPMQQEVKHDTTHPPQQSLSCMKTPRERPAAKDHTCRPSPQTPQPVRQWTKHSTTSTVAGGVVPDCPHTKTHLVRT